MLEQYRLRAPWLSDVAASTVAAHPSNLRFDHDRAAVTLSFTDFTFGSRHANLKLLQI
jgi:hypothetical protein